MGFLWKTGLDKYDITNYRVRMRVDLRGEQGEGQATQLLKIPPAPVSLQCPIQEAH